MPLEQHEGYKDGAHFAEDVMCALQSTKLDLSKPVPLSYFLYLPTEAEAKEAGDLLINEGFEVRVEQSAAGDGKWLCWCDHEILPTIPTLERIGSKFMGLATQYKGNFDGWETNPYKLKGGITDLLSQMLKKFSGAE